MSSWLLLVLISQIILAGAALFDQIIIRNPSLPNPLAYSFWTTLLSTISIIVLFFGLVPFLADLSVPSFALVEMPGLFVSLASLVIGFSFFFGLYFMFNAFAKSEASDVIPAVGAISAIVIFGFESIFMSGDLPLNYLLSFVLLIIGTFFVSQLHFSKKDILFSISAGILFGVHNFLFKIMLDFTNFDSVFTWTRVGYLVAAIVLLLFLPNLRAELKETRSKKKTSISLGAIVGNKVIAGIGGILNLKAIELATASLVQALGGLQYLFLFIFMLIGRAFGVTPKEKGFAKKLTYRLIAIVFISVGFFILF